MLALDVGPAPGLAGEGAEVLVVRVAEERLLYRAGGEPGDVVVAGFMSVTSRTEH